jgi:hypothetical protein
MKYHKIMGLVVVLSAMALMAVTASSASAITKICSTAGSGTACTSGHGSVYKGKIAAKNVGNVILSVTNSSNSVINTVTSTSSEVEGEVTDGELGVGKITKMTFSGLSSSLCSSVTATTTASTANPWPSTVATDGATETTNGIMTTEKVTGSFTCTFLGLPVTCKYFTSKAVTTIDGNDTEPKVTATGVGLEWEEGNQSVCGTHADWTGTYKVTTPSSLFIE